MKYHLLIVLIILISAVIVSAAVPVNVTWGAASSSTPTGISVPFPGFEDEPTTPGPTPVTSDKPILNPLATISKSLVDDLSS